MHQLNPCIKHEPFSVEEERILIAKQREFGNKWSKIAAFLPGRTDNAIKNHWHGHVKRRIVTRVYSSDDDDLVDVEMKNEEPWNEMEVIPVPLIRSRLSSTEEPGNGQQDVECARILVEMSQSQDMHEIPRRYHSSHTFSHCYVDEMAPTGHIMDPALRMGYPERVSTEFIVWSDLCW